MTCSIQDLQTIAQLAYLDPAAVQDSSTQQAIYTLLDFAQTLLGVDTQGILPLFHPMELNQPLRADDVTETDHAAELQRIAPRFAEGHYLVPKVIETEK